MRFLSGLSGALAALALSAPAFAVDSEERYLRNPDAPVPLYSKEHRAAAAPRAQATQPSRALPSRPARTASREYPWDAALDARILRHAAANGVPPELARRVVRIESSGNPRAVSKGNYGLMQIRLGTARAMGYSGNAQGLLDPDVNMTYAMRYLSGALRAAGGDHGRAIRLYQRGYYPEAKRMGFSPYDPPRAAATLPLLQNLR